MKLFCLTLSLVIVCYVNSQSRIENGFARNPDNEPYTNWIDTSYAHCLQNWTTNVEWGSCIGEHHKHWSDFMNQEYAELLNLLDEDGKSRLIASQEAWRKNNKAQDEFWDYFRLVKPHFFGREGHYSSYMIVLENTRNRAVELHTYKKAFSYK